MQKHHIICGFSIRLRETNRKPTLKVSSIQQQSRLWSSYKARTIYTMLATHSLYLPFTVIILRLVRLMMMIMFVLVLALGTSKRVLASDPDILSDYIVPQNVTNVDAACFTYTGFRGIFDRTPETVITTKASMVEFPALNGQSVSYAVLQFPPQTLLPPHTRPDAAGLLFLLDGSLEVGLIDTKNNLYTKKLQAGDMFVFPKGLIHYQYNSHHQTPATAIAAFGSASARAVAAPSSVFTSGIGDVILAKSFKTDVDTIKKIKAGLTTS